MTGGGAPPRVPVKVWILSPPPDAVTAVPVDADGAAVLFDAKLAAALVAPVEFAMAGVGTSVLPAPVAAAPVIPEPAAAAISSAVASGTNRFWVKIQPSLSFWSSQELPLAVGSLTSPGAKVPALRASCGSPPTDAICLARVSVTALFVAAAPAEAGSCQRGLLAEISRLANDRDLPDAGRSPQSRHW